MKKFGFCGVIEFYVNGKIIDIGLFICKCMEIFDEEVLECLFNFMECVVKVKKFFFIWYVFSCMYVYIYLKLESCNLVMGISFEEDVFGSGLIEYDGYVGKLFDKFDELKIVDNIIVIYISDNGFE